MKYLRYYSNFKSITGVAWRIEILQEAVNAYTPEQITLSGDSPLTIEWNEVDKIEPIQASKATLTLASATDRKFIDLYSVEATAIRLDIYRENTLYWSGVLDTELYEEPYSPLNNYDVQITFSDLAVLERLKWDLKGFQKIGDVINYLIEKTQINIAEIDKTNVSTKTISNTDIFSNIQISADNFYDDDDVADSCRDALEAILQPFALRIVQRTGKIYLYDINSIYAKTPAQIVWDGTDATLSADKVYSDVIIKLDANFKNTLAEANVDDVVVENEYQYYVDNRKYNDGKFGAGKGFLFGTGTQAESGFEILNEVKYFKVTPQFSGQKDCGIVWSFRYLPEGKNAAYQRKLNQVTPPFTWAEFYNKFLFEVKHKPLIVRDSFNNNFYIKINMELGFDGRYNPYENASQYNEQGNYDTYNDSCGYVYIPVHIDLIDDNDNVLYHYNNRENWDDFWEDQANGNSGYAPWEKHKDHYEKKGKWVAGANPPFSGESSIHSFFCYYNQNATQRNNWYDRQGNEAAVWGTNKNLIAVSGELPATMLKMNDGEYLPMPPVSGKIRVRVVRGIRAINHWYINDRTGNLIVANHWLMYKNLTISIVDQYGNDIDENTDSENKNGTETRETINAAAKEECSIDTRVGTLEKTSPSALGQLYDLQRQVVSQFKRANETNRLELLLVNTIKANYNTRKNVISGTAKAISDFGILSEKNTAGKFLLASDVQHPYEDTSEIRMIEFAPDKYPTLSISYDYAVCQQQEDTPPPPPTHVYTLGYDLYKCQTN
ncbi:MAG: hypothetical protein LBT56_02925 [Prevotellaceae bacterium]|jgi:hypothetical protein|nr:hypothetical protein [Prevotellaceae bacterium]